MLNPTSASGYIYPSLWLQEHYGKGISDLDNVVECDSHTTSVARLAAGQVDVMVSYGHIRIKNAPIWESDFGGTAPMVEQTGVIGVTDGIYNDMIAYSKTSDTMADEASGRQWASLHRGWPRPRRARRSSAYSARWATTGAATPTMTESGRPRRF